MVKVWFCREGDTPTGAPEAVLPLQECEAKLVRLGRCRRLCNLSTKPRLNPNATSNPVAAPRYVVLEVDDSGKEGWYWARTITPSKARSVLGISQAADAAIVNTRERP